MVFENELHHNLFFTTDLKLQKKNFIKGTIKHHPEEFIVREIDPQGKICNPTTYESSKEQGLYSHCILYKTNIDTLSAVELIAKKLKINSNNIGTAGLKDALASTYQRISIWNIKPEILQEFELEMNSAYISLNNVTLGRYAIKPGDLWGNSFEIKAHITSQNEDTSNITLTNYFNDKWKIIKEKGTPNYFGLQRFGSTRPISHIVGKFILQNNFKAAVDTLLFSTSINESDYITSIRKTHDINEIQKLSPKYSIEKSISRTLQKSKLNYQNAIKRLPESYTKLFISAYQSYLFNKTLHSYMTQILNEELDFNPELDLPLVGYNTKLDHIADNLGERFSRVLNSHDLSLESFYERNTRRFSLKGSTRKAFIFPRKCLINSNNHHSDFNFNFSLPKGSYATIFLRNFFELVLFKNKKNLHT